MDNILKISDGNLEATLLFIYVLNIGSEMNSRLLKTTTTSSACRKFQVHMWKRRSQQGEGIVAEQKA
jgi:hypothetical protein